MHTFFGDHLAEILMLYGLSFFSLGLVVYVLPKQHAGHDFIPHLHWLAAFGLLHGALEFLIYWELIHADVAATLDWANALLLLISFVPLFEFGLRLNFAIDVRRRYAPRLYVLLALAIVTTTAVAGQGTLGMVAATRAVLGFPAALLTGIGFARLAMCVADSRVMRFYLQLAASAFTLYALSTIVLAQVDANLPALFPTQQDFLQTFGIPVQLVRAMCALAALVSLVHLVRQINAASRRNEVARMAETERVNVRLQEEVELRRRSEAELAMMAVAFETQEAVVITDAESRILRVNAAFEQITGYPAQEVLGKTPSLLNSGRHGASFYREMWDELSRFGKWSGEIWNRRKNGEIYPEWLTIAAVKNETGMLAYYVGTFTDITQRKQAEEQIRQLAFYDPLTRLPNRRLLQDRLTQSFNLSMRNRKHGAVMFIDLDNFKNINDSRGHEAGDQLLVEVAGRLSYSVRESDTVARLGGDEFVLVLNDLGETLPEAVVQAEKIAHKLLAALRQPYSLVDGEYHCSASLGISMFMAHEVSIDELFRSADTAMYRAKSSGKNTYFFFDRAMQIALESRLRLEAELRKALEKQQMCLYYQAQTDAGRRVVGAEALLRWKHPERGLVSPGEFIPLAEECGLILPLGQWVLETACAQLKAWEADERYRHLALAVNVSPLQFSQVDFVDRVRYALSQSGANPALLKLELTEGMVVEDVSGCIEKMMELKTLGLSFAVDDFGTGYSSLVYLKRLPLDQLKVDRSFVNEITVDEDDLAIVRTIIAMASNLRLGVVAEGVETEEQFLLLNRNGCLTFQGYLLGKPASREEFEQLLAA